VCGVIVVVFFSSSCVSLLFNVAIFFLFKNKGEKKVKRE